MPIENKKVSIIIPAFNRGKLIGETLESVHLQNYSDWECIIVDDGSTDDTIRIVMDFVKNDSRFLLYSRNENQQKGANTCRNIGVSKSTGSFLLFLDSDDILEKNCLSNRVEALQSDSTLDLVIFDMGLLKNGEKENYEYPDLTKKNKAELEKLFITGPLPWNMTRPLWKKSFFLRVGGFNENLKCFDDDEFNFRAIQLTSAFRFYKVTDCYYRLYQENSEKYYNPEFVDNLLYSYTVFTASVAKHCKTGFSLTKLVAKKTCGIIDAFLKTPKDAKTLKTIIRDFKTRKLISIKSFLLLYIKILLYQTYFKKRGFGKINAFINKQFHFE